MGFITDHGHVKKDQQMLVFFLFESHAIAIKVSLCDPLTAGWLAGILGARASGFALLKTQFCFRLRPQLLTRLCSRISVAKLSASGPMMT